MGCLVQIQYADKNVQPQRGAKGYFCANQIFKVVGTPSGGVWSKTGVISVTEDGLVDTGSISGAATLTYTTKDGCIGTISSNVVICETPIPITSGININDLQNQGWIEAIDSMTISGWAAKGKIPSAVDIYIDNVKYTANPILRRPDVSSILNAPIELGYYDNFGWSFNIPQTFTNTLEGKHNVAVYFANTQMLLSSNLPLFYYVAPQIPIIIETPTAKVITDTIIEKPTAKVITDPIIETPTATTPLIDNFFTTPIVTIPTPPPPIYDGSGEDNGDYQSSDYENSGNDSGDYAPSTPPIYDGSSEDNGEYQSSDYENSGNDNGDYQTNGNTQPTPPPPPPISNGNDYAPTTPPTPPTPTPPPTIEEKESTTTKQPNLKPIIGLGLLILLGLVTYKILKKK
jgi:hypothetical protein